MPKYIKNCYKQLIMVPIDLEKQIEAGSLEFAIKELIDTRIDVGPFEQEIKNDETGRPAWDPRVMLKIILLAYSRGIVSSRKIARACEENMTFIAISGWSKPHFTVIAEFIAVMKAKIVPLFRNVLLICDEMGLLGGTSFALDGLKLPCNASREWSGTRKELQKKKGKLEEKIKSLLSRHQANDRDEEKRTNKERDTPNDAEVKRAKRVERLQKQADKIEGWLKENEEKVGKRGKELKRNITDNDSCSMKTAHGVVQGYNGQVVVDQKHQVIVAAEAFGSGQEHELFEPMMEGAKENIQAIGHKKSYFKNKTLIADTGYFSEETLKVADDAKLDAYIPDQQFRRRDPRFATAFRHKPQKKQFTKEDFTYIAENDTYRCPNGKTLILECLRNNFGNSSGRKYQARQTDCSPCPIRTRCLRKPTTQRRYLFIAEHRFGRSYSKAMIEKIDTPKGREVYSQRMGIVEPVFANIRHQKRLDRFTLRGKSKVNVQWLLFCIVHNIEKISHYAMANA